MMPTPMEPLPQLEVEQETWQQLLGSKNWDNLLEPLDLNLRKLILRCGDFCQATYDAFNNDKNSKFCGTSRYGKTNFFHKVMNPEAAQSYEVSCFLYATARVSLPEAFLLHSQSRESRWDRESNWIGYIAVSSDEASAALGRREIYVAFRGTTRNYEWINVMGAKLRSARPLLRNAGKVYLEADPIEMSSSESEDDEETPMVKVMLGWLAMYVSEDSRSSFTKLSLRSQLLSKIQELRERYEGEKLSIIFTGHSLGASLSILSAWDLVENGITDIPVAAFVFGCPKVGNKTFNDRFKLYPNLKVLHIKNRIDVIPHYPARLLGYVYTGTELEIDTRKSPSLRDSKNPSDWHNLQAILHIVAGWNGEGGEFELKVKRSLALVNKSCEFLKDECMVPGSWWVEKNKGMIRDEDGEWVLAPPDEEDLPVPDKNWDNLLEPLDLNLRKLILRCGDFCQATYDAFNNDKNSKYCGSSRYGKTNFFKKVMNPEADKSYQVFAFLYATARVSLPEAFLLRSQVRGESRWDRESNWFGYIAVSSDEASQALGRREIYVAFRGTTRNHEWATVLGAKPRSAAPLLRGYGQTPSGNSSSDNDDDDEAIPKVMLGWLSMYISDDPNSPFTKLSLRTQLSSKIQELRERYRGEKLSIIFTGHSLGASISILSAWDLVENGITDIPVTAVVFGSPQIGNRVFNNRFNQYPNLKVLHVKNKIDVLVHYPGPLMGYAYTGTDFEIDTRKSPSLKPSRNPGDWHNLQAMLHIVAGWNGEGGEFELKVKRSLALVNKSCEFLKDECMVPGSWWVEKNKGMVRNEDGEWVMASPDEEDLPVPEF
ncbi:hypothetical protein Tsubulata_017334 [Turnera subulata]|uniref:Phospholipase A1 n=1 Tax=Turnera subulata TaxID=218843 RepID=A0A9Q0FVA0_9ROSI|nr:hypothetical protein Tsubulata_017334 [Turnera subulata]